MTKTQKAIVLALATALLFGVALVGRSDEAMVATKSAPAKEVEPARPALNHQQEVWTYALEWCESRGEVGAINPKDKDGTPSYYSFQFKPSTFRFYGERYGILSKGLTDTALTDKLKDYKTQRAIVEQMVLHAKEIDWKQQFPDCVRKLGMPPIPHSPTR